MVDVSAPPAPEQDAKREHRSAYAEVEPVVLVIERHDVRGRVLVDHESADPEREIDEPTSEEERPRAPHELDMAMPRTPKSRWTML